MWTLVVGFIVIFSSIRYSAEISSNTVFFNQHSLLVVVGGTLGVLICSNPPSVLITLVKSLWSLLYPERGIEAYDAEFKEVERSRTLPQKSTNQLINAGITLWESGIGTDSFVVLLERRRIELEQRGQDALVALRNLSKYPPAFGMTGTVYGLTNLFSQLGQDGGGSIGPALAFAMTATFLGLVLSNAVVNPVSDRLQIVISKRRRLFQDTYRRLLLIHYGESTNLLDNQEESGGAKNAA